MLYYVVLTFESLIEILKWDHLCESDGAVLSCGPVYHAIRGGFKNWSLGLKFCGVTIQVKVTGVNRDVEILTFCGVKVVCRGEP